MTSIRGIDADASLREQLTLLLGGVHLLLLQLRLLLGVGLLILLLLKLELLLIYDQQPQQLLSLEL